MFILMCIFHIRSKTDDDVHDCAIPHELEVLCQCKSKYSTKAMLNYVVEMCPHSKSVGVRR